MAAGDTSSTRRGATIHEIADDPRSSWCALARRVLDDLQTQDHARRQLDASDATGLQQIVWALYQPWSRKRYSFRSLAQATGTTPHNVEKHLHAAEEAIRRAPQVDDEVDDLDVVWAVYRGLERVMQEPPGGGQPDPHRGARRQQRLTAKSERTGFTVDHHDHTHWPQEKWRGPGADGYGYGPVEVLPQDGDAGRDVLTEQDRHP